MAEKVFFTDPRLGITVTSARLVTPGQTYAMRAIESVGVDSHEVGTWPGSFIFCIAAAGLFALLSLGAFASAAYGTGMLLIVLCASVITVGQSFRSKSIAYTVLLSTASGKQRAFSSSNQSAVNAIADAVNQAIAS